MASVAVTIGSGPITVSHGLGTVNVIAQVWSNGQLIPPSSYRLQIQDANTLILDIEGYSGSPISVNVIAS